MGISRQWFSRHRTLPHLPQHSLRLLRHSSGLRRWVATPLVAWLAWEEFPIWLASTFRESLANAAGEMNLKTFTSMFHLCIRLRALNPAWHRVSQAPPSCVADTCKAPTTLYYSKLECMSSSV